MVSDRNSITKLIHCLAQREEQVNNCLETLCEGPIPNWIPSTFVDIYRRQAVQLLNIGLSTEQIISLAKEYMVAGEPGHENSSTLVKWALERTSSEAPSLLAQLYAITKLGETNGLRILFEVDASALSTGRKVSGYHQDRSHAMRETTYERDKALRNYKNTWLHNHPGERFNASWHACQLFKAEKAGTLPEDLAMHIPLPSRLERKFGS